MTVDLAGTRGIVIGHAAALTARARVHAAHASTDPARRAASLGRARADADAALRLATCHGLAWYELDALYVHTDLDHLHRHWAPATEPEKRQALSRRLIAPGLDPDPPTTIEREAAARSESEPG